jgi:hypothetical protein
VTGVTVNSAQVIAVGAQPHDDHDLDNLNFVTISRRVRATKAKWRIFPKDTEEKMRFGKYPIGNEPSRSARTQWRKRREQQIP